MDDFLPKIARDLNILTEDNPRKVKLNSIKRIAAEIQQVPTDIVEHSAKELLRVLNYCLSDSVESVRETAVSLLHDIVLKLEKDKILPILSLLIPTLKDRLGNKELLVESSEEIRLLLLKLLRTIVSKTMSDYNNYVEHAVDILKVVLSDPYQGCRKEACAIVELLAQYNDKALGMFGDSIVKAVLPCVGHRHSAVRILGLQALKAAMIVNLDGLDDALTHLWALTLDSTGSVREKLYTVAGEWLLELPDRYSIGYKILPLLLAGLQDDMPSLRDKTRFYINEAGKLYEKEWESRVKDEMDYTDGRNASDNRPGVGCRHLARDNTLKIVEKMVEGMGDWTPDKRAKSAQILSSFIDYTEDKISGYTATILAALYKIMAGDESLVINNVSISFFTYSVYSCVKILGGSFRRMYILI
jgi:dynein assembly factor 5